MGCSPSTTAVSDQSYVEIKKEFHDTYILGVKLGRGAFAQVCVATKISDEEQSYSEGSSTSRSFKERAVKIIDLRDKNKPGEASKSTQKAVNNEATVWAAVGSHANVVRLYEVFTSFELCYMVMERCSTTLLQCLDGMIELNERSVGKVFVQMLNALTHVHAVKVIHRDVKPDNFLVGCEYDQTVKLADFGLSTLLPKQGKAQGVFGTAPFMCPEMLGGRGYDEKVDVWSFGTIVYVFLFGNFPYVPKEQGSKGMKQAILEAAPPKFEPHGKPGAQNSHFRTDGAIDFAKCLLNREPEERPSAIESLHLAYMTAVVENRHAPATELPSLRQMLHCSRKVGAFETRDPSRETNADSLLNKLQLKRHGIPVPPTPANPLASKSSSERRHGDEDKRSRRTFSPSNWENQSSRSTNCSDIDDSLGSFRGSGWSKTNSAVVSTPGSAALSPRIDE